jgi:hypothetical protein
MLVDAVACGWAARQLAAAIKRMVPDIPCLLTLVMYGANDDGQLSEVDSLDSKYSSESSSSTASEDEQDHEVQQPATKHRVEHRLICPFSLTSDGLVLCTMCKIGIVPHPDSVSSQRAHLKKYHRDNAFGVQEFLSIKSVSEIQALYDDSLAVRPQFQQFPVLEGYKCSICGIVSASVRKMRGHLTKNHADMQRTIACHAQKVFVQVFE